MRLFLSRLFLLVVLVFALPFIVFDYIFKTGVTNFLFIWTVHVSYRIESKTAYASYLLRQRLADIIRKLHET